MRLPRCVVAGLIASLGAAAEAQVPVGNDLRLMLHGRLSVRVPTAALTTGADADAPGYYRPLSTLRPAVRQGTVLITAREDFLRIEDHLDRWLGLEALILGRPLTPLVTTPTFGLWAGAPHERQGPARVEVLGVARMPDHRQVHVSASVSGAPLWDRCVGLARELAVSPDGGCAGVLRQVLATVRPTADSDLVLPGGEVQFPLRPSGGVGTLTLPPGWAMLVDDDAYADDRGVTTTITPVNAYGPPPTRLQIYTGTGRMLSRAVEDIQRVPGVLFGTPITWFRSGMRLLNVVQTTTYFRGALPQLVDQPVAVTLETADAAREATMRAIVASSRLTGHPSAIVTPTWSPEGPQDDIGLGGRGLQSAPPARPPPAR